MTKPEPLTVIGLSIGYSLGEDRLVLFASHSGGNELRLLLTRRLTGRLINGLAKVLERSSVTAAKAPAEMLDDIILMEHQDALYGDVGGKQDASGSATSSSPGLRPKSFEPPRLVTSIDITTKPLLFQIVLRDALGSAAGLNVNRRSLHRILETMSRHAEAAEWHITIDARWLETGQTEILLN